MLFPENITDTSVSEQSIAFDRSSEKAQKLPITQRIFTIPWCRSSPGQKRKRVMILTTVIVHTLCSRYAINSILISKITAVSMLTDIVEGV